MQPLNQHVRKDRALVLIEVRGPQFPNEGIFLRGSAIAKLQATEKLILEPARRPDFDHAEFEKAWSAFEQERT